VLEREVPIRAAQYHVDLRPDITTGIRPPDNIYVRVKPATPPLPLPWPAISALGTMNAETKTGPAKRGWSTKGLVTIEADTKSNAEGSIQHVDGPARETRSSPKERRRSFEGKNLLRRDKERWVIAERDLKHRTRALRESYDAEEARPTHFETGAGFSIEGAAAMRATLGKVARRVSEAARGGELTPSILGRMSSGMAVA
jgi:hypothetical protein